MDVQARVGWYNTILTAPNAHTCPTWDKNDPWIWKVLQPWYMWRVEVEVATRQVVEPLCTLHGPKMDVQARVVGWSNTILTGTHTYTYPTSSAQITPRVENCCSHDINIWRAEFEVPTWQVVEVSMYLPCNQHEFACKSDGVMQFCPYSNTHPYVPVKLKQKSSSGESETERNSNHKKIYR